MASAVYYVPLAEYKAQQQQAKDIEGSHLRLTMRGYLDPRGDAIGVVEWGYTLPLATCLTAKRDVRAEIEDEGMAILRRKAREEGWMIGRVEWNWLLVNKQQTYVEDQPVFVITEAKE